MTVIAELDDDGRHAVAAAMLSGLGFSPFYAAAICLLANTAPVAFGSIGTPVLATADEAVRPAALRQILLASLFGSKHRLKLAQGFGKRWARHAHIL